MSLSYAILGVLAADPAGPMQGYAVHRELSASLGGIRPVNHGQVYATLDRLARDGLVVRAARGDRGARFAIASAGRRRLQSWLERPVGWRRPAGEVPARLALLAASRDAPGIARLLARQRTRIAALEHVLRARGGGLAAEAALRHLAAERDWLAVAERALADGDPSALD